MDIYNIDYDTAEILQYGDVDYPEASDSDDDNDDDTKE